MHPKKETHDFQLLNQEEMGTSINQPKEPIKTNNDENDQGGDENEKNTPQLTSPNLKTVLITTDSSSSSTQHMTDY